MPRLPWKLIKKIDTNWRLFSMQIQLRIYVFNFIPHKLDQDSLKQVEAIHLSQLLVKSQPAGH
jgi:hypothetical protein